MLRDIPVDTSLIEARVVTVTSRLDNDGNQRTDSDGRPTFSVQLAAIITRGDSTSFEAITVTVAAGADGKAPLQNVPAYTPVTLQGLRARPWQMESRSGIAFSADAIHPVTASSRKEGQ